MADGPLRTMKAKHRTYRRRHPMRRAAIGLGLAGLAYAVSSAVLAASGAVPAAPVVAGLDIDNYYAWQILFVLPLVFAVWILSSGVLLALGTRGCHRSDILVKASRAWGGPLLLAWAALGMGQEEWVGFLSEPGLWQSLYLGLYAAAAIWAASRFVGTARTIHQKSWPVAFLTGLAASAVALGAFALFIR
jgi:hypothetical protein